MNLRAGRTPTCLFCFDKQANKLYDLIRRAYAYEAVFFENAELVLTMSVLLKQNLRR